MRFRRQHEHLDIAYSQRRARTDAIPGPIRDAVDDRLDPARQRTELAAEMGRGIGRHADDVRAAPERHTQRDAAPALGGDVLAAMHRDHVRQPQPAGGRRAIDRHRELVAVDHFDATSAEDVDHLAQTPPIEGPPDGVRLGFEPMFAHTGAEPSDPVGRPHRDDRVAAVAQRDRETGDHDLRATGSVGLEHLRDP